MPGDGGPTALVTGAAGFIGTELIKVLVARGHQGFGTCQIRGVDAARSTRGSIAIRGDLLVPGQWQDEAHLLDAVAAGATRRIVYVGDSRACGPTGSRPVTEDDVSVSPVRGRGLVRERVVDPIMAGRRVLQFGRAGPWVSPIHVHDCASSRYFLTNNEAIQVHDFALTVARLAHRPLRVWLVPAVAAGLLVGRPLADCVRGNLALSNIRLRGIGFRFRYPTIEQGIEQVLGALHE